MLCVDGEDVTVLFLDSCEELNLNNYIKSRRSSRVRAVDQTKFPGGRGPEADALWIGRGVCHRHPGWNARVRIGVAGQGRCRVRGGMLGVQSFSHVLVFLSHTIDT